MRKLLAVGVALGLVGCHGLPLKELTEGPPRLSGQVDKSYSVFSKCVIDTLKTHTPFNLLDIQGGTRIAVLMGVGGNPYGVLDIVRAGESRSQYTYYQNGKDWGLGQRVFHTSINSCV